MKVTWHPPYQPDIRPIGEGYYRLHASYTVELDGHIELKVQEGFRTDGASVPRLAWWFMPPDGTWRAASVIHDYLCYYAGNITVLTSGGWKTYELDDKDAADIFYQLMMEFDVKPWRAKIAYRAVRWFGPHW